jgi:hypothetical protein
LVKACGAFFRSDKNTIPQSVLQRNENKKEIIIEDYFPLEALVRKPGNT